MMYNFDNTKSIYFLCNNKLNIFKNKLHFFVAEIIQCDILESIKNCTVFWHNDLKFDQ